jgi:hypothetical protein
MNEESEAIDKLQKRFLTGVDEWKELKEILADRAIESEYPPEKYIKVFWKEEFDNLKQCITDGCDVIDKYWGTYEED